MTTFFMGQVDEVRPTSRKNKDTGQITKYATVTATLETQNNEGYLIKATEDVQFSIDLLGSLQAIKGKFIAIPYAFISTPKGSYLFPDDNLKFTVFDKNPLEVKK